MRWRRLWPACHLRCSRRGVGPPYPPHKLVRAHPYGLHELPYSLSARIVVNERKGRSPDRRPRTDPLHKPVSERSPPACYRTFVPTPGGHLVRFARKGAGKSARGRLLPGLHGYTLAREHGIWLLLSFAADHRHTKEAASCRGHKHAVQVEQPQAAPLAKAAFLHRYLPGLVCWQAHRVGARREIP